MSAEFYNSSPGILKNNPSQLNVAQSVQQPSLNHYVKGLFREESNPSQGRALNLRERVSEEQDLIDNINKLYITDQTYNNELYDRNDSFYSSGHGPKGKAAQPTTDRSASYEVSPSTEYEDA